MSDRYNCPLCTETYGERTDLRVHLEVEHRKSDIVAEFIQLQETVADTPAGGDPTIVDEERPAPSAD